MTDTNPMTPDQITASRDRLVSEGFHPRSTAVMVHDQLLGMREWWPINTAPKNTQIVAAAWDNETKSWYSEDVEWAQAYSRNGTLDEWWEGWSLKDLPPTHWISLPNPPAEREGA